MKRFLLISAFLLMSTALVHAQGAISMQSNGEGFFVGLHLGAATWTVDDLQIDAESGGGGGLTVGYGFSQLISAYLSADAASISPDLGESYTLGHGDLGVLFTFGSTTSAVRPYADVAFGVRQASADLVDDTTGQTEELTISGTGLTVGGGVRYHLSLPLAIDAGVKASFGNLTEAELGGVTIQLPESASANSIRINVGVVWFPGQ